MYADSFKSSFAIRKDERRIALAAMLVLGVFQYLMVARFFPQFARYDLRQWETFMANFHMSGFDPYTYRILTDFHSYYDPLRHPLLAMALYPMYLANRGLWLLTGANCCQLLMAAVLWVANGYAFLWLYRTLAHAIGLSHRHALLLAAFFFGFAYILLSTFVPDHFGLSQPILLLTLCRAAIKMRHHSSFSDAEALFLFTAATGLTLTNGVSVFLMILATNGHQTLRPRRLIRVFILPSTLLLATAMAARGSHTARNNSPGTAVGNQLRWIKPSAPRACVALENFFGESIQLHRRHLLGDVLTRRPVIVRYHRPLQYVAEGLILLLFTGGCVAGRRQRLLWAVLSVLGFNAVLHLVVGFAIDEVHIMAAHWAFCIPVAIAFLLKPERPKTTVPTALSLSALTLYLWIYHGLLLHHYLTWPVRALTN